MQQTPFHAYYTARILDSLSDDGFVPAFASTAITIYSSNPSYGGKALSIKVVEAERETITNDRLKLLALDKNKASPTGVYEKNRKIRSLTLCVWIWS